MQRTVKIMPENFRKKSIKITKKIGEQDEPVK